MFISFLFGQTGCPLAGDNALLARHPLAEHINLFSSQFQKPSGSAAFGNIISIAFAGIVFSVIFENLPSPGPMNDNVLQCSGDIYHRLGAA